MSRENRYQARLIKRILREFVGSVVIKNDPGYQQGILDLTVLFEDMWAMLEVKISADAPVRPNQEYYVDLFNSMSFAAFIYPENEEDVLRALQQTFTARRSSARLS